MLGMVPRTVEPEANMLPTLASIEKAITKKTRAVVTISPNNPSGMVFPAALLQSINQLCKERKIYHISDEAYEYFLFDNEKHFSPEKSVFHYQTGNIRKLRLRYGRFFFPCIAD